MLKQETLLP